MSSVHQIDILISVFNGADFLDEQLASIVAQDIGDWHIYIRDDGSEDNSVSIIEAFVTRYPNRVSIITEPFGRLGLVASFECLLTNSSSPYIAFCDQDDVWLPQKLRLLRACMLDVESASGPQTPILVHSDLQVVDVDLALVSDSFWKYQKLKPSKMQSLERVLIQNCVTGCATMVNRALVDHALPIPKNVIMHDWWFALVAASEGKIENLSARTVKYRQHDKNDTGAKRWNINYVLSGMFRNRDLYKKSIIKTRDQAKALLLSGKSSGEHAEIVSQYVDLFDRGWFCRRLTVVRMGFYKYGFVRNVALMLWL